MYIPTLLRRKRSRAVSANLRFLLESQYWPREKIRAYQWDRLTALLHHAYRTVPYYRKAFCAIGANPGDIKSEEDFAGLPILTKTGIQQNFEELVSDFRERSAYLPNATGGSTGTPLNFYQDAGYSAWAGAARIRAWKHMVGGSSDRIEALFWGSVADIGTGFSAKKAIYHLLREGNLPLNTFDLDEGMLRRYLRYYNAVRPPIIRGYATSLHYVASFIRENRLQVHAPRAAISSAEVLYPHMRRMIAEVFATEVYDSYGCREVSQIATECEAHNGLHIVCENQYVELVDSQIVVTNLNNYAMPFIRYQVGDVAERIDYSPCPCGRQSPRLTKIVGRDNANICLPSGKVINGEFFEFLFFGHHSVKRFQVIYRRQRQLLCIKLEMTGSDRSIEATIREKMKRNFNFDKIQFEYSNDFARTPSGKFRFVYSVDE